MPLSLHRVVFPQKHIFASERVGWRGMAVGSYGTIDVSITFAAGSNRFMAQSVHDSFEETYWGSCEQVIKFVIKSIGEDVNFPDDNLMQQAASRVQIGVEDDQQS